MIQNHGSISKGNVCGREEFARLGRTTNESHKRRPIARDSSRIALSTPTTTTTNDDNDVAYLNLPNKRKEAVKQQQQQSSWETK